MSQPSPCALGLAMLRGVALAAALLGCATPEITTPLPKNVSIIAPGPDIPEPVAAYSGVWKGRWDRVSGPNDEHTLIVRRIRPVAPETYSVSVVTSWGGSRPGYRSESGTIRTDGVLQVGQYYTYTIGADRKTIVTRYASPSGANRAVLWRVQLFPDSR